MSKFSTDKHRIARKQLGLFFAERRKEMGHSCKVLADFIGVTENTMQRIEAGAYDYDIMLLFKICEALEIKPFFVKKENESNFTDTTFNLNDIHTCYYCRRKYGSIYNHAKGVQTLKKTKDHIYPKALGGAATTQNIIHCCDKCNKFKGKRTLAEWRNMILDALDNVDPQQGIVMKNGYSWRITQFKHADLRVIANNLLKLIDRQESTNTIH